MDTKEELYLEYARCINMCKGTEVKPWECVRFDVLAKFNKHPVFYSEPEDYKFAIFILEGKPVFLGDILYLKDGAGKKCEVYKEGYRTGNDELTDVFIAENWQKYVRGGIEYVWSWNPPKKQKSSFALNFVNLPSPISMPLLPENAISIISGRFVQHFEFESKTDADLVALEIRKILTTAFEERNKP